MLPPAVAALVAAALGLIFGSFANVCIHRVPAGESVVRPRSRCPRCGAAIAWHDNIPVISWLALRARCRSCAEPIPWSYPLVEAAMGAGFLASWALFGATLEGAASCWLVFSCIVLWGIDSRHFILPDVVTLTGLIAGILFAVLRGIARLPSAGEAAGADLLLGGAADRPPLLASSLAGALAGAAIPLLARGLYRISRRFRGGRAGDERLSASSPDAAAGGEPDDIRRVALREGMGLGDVKMLAMVGAFLGPRAVLITILAGSVAGCLIVIPWMLATGRDFKTPVPFGPFLAAGALLALFAGDPLAEGYGRLIFRLLG